MDRARTRRRLPPQERVDQILDAAEAVLLERGLEHATVADIAERAGLGKGTVYLYFDTKPAIVAALRRRYVERLEAAVRDAAATQPAPERLRAGVLALALASSERPALHHLLFQDAGVVEEDAFGPLQARLVELAGAPAPRSRARRDEVAAAFMVGGVHAAIALVAHAPARQRPEMARRVAELAHGIVGAQGAERRR